MSIQNIPSNPGYILRFKRGAVSFLAGMRRHVLSYPHDNGSESFSSPPISPWEWLIDCVPVGYYYTAVSAAEGLMLQKEEFISSLLQPSPRLNQYWTIQVHVYEYCYRLYINFHAKLPYFFALAPVINTCPVPHHLCPAVTQLPTIPIIVITDVDGSQAGLYNALHETQDILRRGDRLLWREWTGKFSIARKTEDLFFDGAPPMPEDQEDEVHAEAGNPTTSANIQEIPSEKANCPKQSLNDSQNPEWVWEEDEGSVQADTINEDNDLSKGDKVLTINTGQDDDVAKDDELVDIRAVDTRTLQHNAPRELEWWERDDYPEDEDEEDEEVEEGEGGSDDEDSDEEDSEDGDDELEDDSDDDGYEEDFDAEGDLNETSTDKVCSTTSHRISAIETAVSLLCGPKPQHVISIRAQTVDLRHCQVPQDGKGSGAPLSFPPSSSCFSISDSDLESSNSSATISSITTPITPASPSVTPIDSSDLRKSRQGCCNELLETSWLLMNSLDVALGAARRSELELELEFQASLQ